MRRMLYAFGGDGNIAITRQEAEVLFDINDATDADEELPPGRICSSRRWPIF